MLPIHNNIASSIAGAKQAERTAVREQDKAAKRGRRPAERITKRDEVEVGEVEHAEATRNAKGNDQEETHEDREARGHYDAHGGYSVEREPPRLDLEG